MEWKQLEFAILQGLVVLVQAQLLITVISSPEQLRVKQIYKLLVVVASAWVQLQLVLV